MANERVVRAVLANLQSDDDAFKLSRKAVKRKQGRYVQWTSGDEIIFRPSGSAYQTLTPGVYSIDKSTQLGLFFERIDMRSDELLELPSTNLRKVVLEIEKFWDREELFRRYEVPYKRGILLWGPPGCGKTCCIQLVARDVVDRGGVVIEFENPALFMEGYRVLRQIQPEVPVVVVMEDLDAILERWDESLVLNILDGIEKVDRVVFLATTNYPERLGPRVVNRPSRFDKRFKIGYPKAESRRMYIEFLARQEDDFPVDKWVRDTDGFSLAHIKELFVAVVILGDDYQSAVKTLRNMRENKIGSFKDEVPGDDESAEIGMGGYA